MVILTLLNSQDGTPLRQWSFEHDTCIRIGRAPENQVILADPVVSRFHLELRKIAQPAAVVSTSARSEWTLINQSTNGTFVGGDSIAETVLPDNALMQLAYNGPILRFQEATRSSPQPQLLAATLTASPGITPDGLPPLLDDKVEFSSPTGCTHIGNPPENLFCIHCGQPVRVEKTVRQYQMLRVLGRGGMGTTYLAWNPSGVPKPAGTPQGRLQVLKEMNADVARIPKAHELFEREAGTLKGLDHPGIPHYYDFFLEEDKKYLVMELVHGHDLEKHVRQQGAVSADAAIAWMIQVCEVLDYLHNRASPIIHRDIKPGNLLVRNLDNRIVVLDFGAVKEVGMPPGTRIGAEGYCAPEQAQGRAVIQSDLYSVGSSLVFLLTGNSPQRFIKRQGKGYRLAIATVEQIPNRLRLVVQRATEPNPYDRYQSAKELMAELSECRQHLNKK